MAAVLLETLAGIDGGLMTSKLFEAFIAAISARPRRSAPLSVGQQGPAALLTGAPTPRARAETVDSRSRLYVLRLLLDRLPDANRKVLRCAPTRHTAARTRALRPRSRRAPPARAPGASSRSSRSSTSALP